MCPPGKDRKKLLRKTFKGHKFQTSSGLRMPELGGFVFEEKRAERFFRFVAPSCLVFRNPFLYLWTSWEMPPFATFVCVFVRVRDVKQGNST